MIFQSNKNLPHVFPKGQLNLLYKLKQKDSFILQKFQSPAIISLSSISENCKKLKASFSLSPTPDAPRLQSLPLTTPPSRHSQHRRFRPLIRSASFFPKPAYSCSVIAVVFFENPKRYSLSWVWCISIPTFQATLSSSL